MMLYVDVSAARGEGREIRSPIHSHGPLRDQRLLGDDAMMMVMMVVLLLLLLLRDIENSYCLIPPPGRPDGKRCSSS